MLGLLVYTIYLIRAVLALRSAPERAAPTGGLMAKKGPSIGLIYTGLIVLGGFGYLIYGGWATTWFISSRRVSCWPRATRFRQAGSAWAARVVPERSVERAAARFAIRHA
jgi:hypothetical protein